MFATYTFPCTEAALYQTLDIEMLQNNSKFLFYFSIFFFKFQVSLLVFICSWRTTDYKVHRVCRRDENEVQVYESYSNAVARFLDAGLEVKVDGITDAAGARGDAELDRKVSGCWPECLVLADNMFFIASVCF